MFLFSHSELQYKSLGYFSYNSTSIVLEVSSSSQNVLVFLKTIENKCRSMGFFSLNSNFRRKFWKFFEIHILQ